MNLFKALMALTPARRKPAKPYAGRQVVKVKRGGATMDVWLAPSKAARLAVGQTLQVYTGPHRHSIKTAIYVWGRKDTGKRVLWFVEYV